MKTLLALALTLATSLPAFAVSSNKYDKNLAFGCYLPSRTPGVVDRYQILSDSYTTTGYGKWTGTIKQLWIVEEKTGKRQELFLLIPAGRRDSSLGLYGTQPDAQGKRFILNIKSRDSRDGVDLEDQRSRGFASCHSHGDCC